MVDCFGLSFNVVIVSLYSSVIVVCVIINLKCCFNC